MDSSIDNQFDNKNLKRCFFHELGHFFAHYYNSRHFNMADTDNIDFFYRSVDEEYCGRLIPKRPEDYSDYKYPVVNLPEVLASLVYGCIFQCQYSGDATYNCFGDQEWMNGNDDYFNFNGGLIQFKVYNSEIHAQLLNYFREYCHDLQRYDKELNDELSKIQIDESVLVKTQYGFSANIEVLRSKVSGLLAQHEVKYLEFVDGIKKILNWNDQDKGISN